VFVSLLCRHAVLRVGALPVLSLQVLLMGGVDTRQALTALRAGCEIVVATPGVLQEFAKVCVLASRPGNAWYP
jgi:superfamily II DNA/RNA helicase